MSDQTKPLMKLIIKPAKQTATSDLLRKEVYTKADRQTFTSVRRPDGH